MTVNHHEMNIVNDVVQSFEKSVNHAYLQKYIGEPPVNKDHVLILYRMLRETGKDEQEIHHTILSAQIVQSALDTHENVVKKGLGPEDAQIKQQLTVLGGDYYSSLYYYILSRSGDIFVIRALTKGIQKINEAKMSIYQLSRKHPLPSLDELKTVYSSLAVELAEAHGLKEWVEPLRSYFLIQGLTEERHRIYTGEEKGLASNFFQNKGPYSATYGAEDSLQALNVTIQEETAYIERVCAENKRFSELLLPVLSGSVYQQSLYKTCAVEEG